MANNILTNPNSSNADFPTAGAYSGASPSFSNSTVSKGNITVNTSVLPFMRQLNINFAATGLKPDARMYPFFDGTDIRFDIATADVLQISVLGGVAVPTIEGFKFSSYAKVSQTVTGGTATGTVLQCRNGFMHVLRDPTSPSFAVNGNPVEFLWNETTNGVTQNVNTTFTLVSLVKSSRQRLKTDGSTVTWTLDYEVTTPFTAADIQVTLNGVVQTNVTNWTLDGPGLNITWVGYTPKNTDIIHVYFPWAIRTDDSGYLSGVFECPAATFKTGTRVLRFIDNSTNDLITSTCSADYAFQASGVSVKPIESVVATRPCPPINWGPPVFVNGIRQLIPGGPTYVDPLAQSFLIDGKVCPNGIFLDSIDLCFRTKDPLLPVMIQLRPMVNGYPDSSNVLPGSTVILDSAQVKITGIIGLTALPGIGFTVDGELVPSFSDPRTFTNFKFNFPVYLKPNTEYAVIVHSDSDLYHTFIAKVGNTQLGSTNKITKQPYAGSLFLSQNSSTWTADQTSDLMFRLNQCVFETSGSIIVEPDGFTNSDDFTYDSLWVATENVEFGSITNVDYGIETTDSVTGLLSSSYLPFSPRQEIDFDTRQVMTTQSTELSATTGQTVYTVPYLNVTKDEIDILVIDPSDYYERVVDKAYYYLRTKVAAPVGTMELVWNSTVKAPPATGSTIRFVRSNYASISLDLSTTDPNVSPVIDLAKLALRFTHNEINAGEINAANIKLPDSGVAANLTLAVPTVTLANGTGGSIRTITIGGYLVGLIIDSAGSGYLTTSATVSAPGGGGVNATISLIVDGGGAITGATITNQGSGYPESTVAITSTTGSGAVIYPIVQQATAGNATSGYVMSWFVQSGGQNYVDNFSINLVRSDTTTFALTVTNECSPAGGNCITRYISSRVTLADGFDAADLQVYMSVMKPQGCTIDVFYKVLAADDNTDWSARPWVPMVNTGDVQSLNTEDYKEMQFNTIGGTAAYGGFTQFKMFSIKIVLTATNTANPPRVHDLRAIALATTF